jgi:hypothetical protein
MEVASKPLEKWEDTDFKRWSIRWCSSCGAIKNITEVIKCNCGGGLRTIHPIISIHRYPEMTADLPCDNG